ncbi:ankyrin repeat domain-containing protein [Antarcticibacterium sp. 1MA-6-2]|uniref:ankyrin repeat domain-containing protein n=1 Tax=Antarcticibacterium sp. 1MA-6-2 TaxID=2908210 RepID=UPI001F39638A|nr:ankyrin repeat domain-containing protein [Antarcticibacterium sp. 1MA-6-2]UJH92801.1 ankyrin repeat domain-containing protein [Antarcticibacterium sp. 1MA-6-2]
MKKISFLLLFIGATILGYAQKLYRAVEDGDIDKVTTLLAKNADVAEYNKKGLFPLWRSAADNNYEISELLIKSGADVNQKNKVAPGNSTPIQIPCQEGYFEIVRLLVNNGADVNLKGYLEFTPIRVAAQNGHMDIVRFLSENGAEIDTKARDGATPLEHAASKGHFEIVKYIVENGADVNNINAEGDFPIGEAAKSGHLTIIQLLIDNGANLSLKNNQGKNAFELAKEKNQTKAADLIKKFI